MNWEKGKFGKIVVNAVFCILVVILFGTNSLLRPMAVNAPYAEYITGVLVLVLFYLNRYLLYEKLFLRGKISQYMYVTLLSLMAVLCIEAVLVYSSLMPELQSYFHRTAWLYFVLYILMMLGRDAAFFLASFFICNVIRQKELNNVYEQHLKEVNDEILVNWNNEIIPEDYSDTQNISQEDNLKHKALSAAEFVKVEDILYIEQGKGMTFIHTINNDIYIRISSLKRSIELIGIKNMIQVSKSAAVNNNYVSHFDKNNVTLLNPNTDKVYTVKIGSPYYETSAGLLKYAIDNNQNKKIVSTAKDWDTPALLKNKKTHRIYCFIKKHPGCKASYLSDKISIPVGSLNRILAQLKKEGLIEYVGSKKTGGYKVVEG